MVLRATNSREIVLRLTNNTEKLDKLITDLHKFYNEDRKGKRVENLIINKIYAAVFDGAVFRVQSILIEGKEVYCWFLDDGIIEKINKSNLYEIDNEFMKLPFQAFNVRLDGLQDQSESLIQKFIDNKMKENDDALCLIARIIPTETTNDDTTNDDTTNDETTLIVRLYDTSKDDQDIDLNKEIIEFIENSNTLPGSKNSIPKALLPKFDLNNNEFESIKVRVSLILNPHNFIVTNVEHFEKDSKYQQLNNQLQEFYSKNDEYVELIESMIYPGLFVCVRDLNLKWYRARVDDLANSRCTCYLVDEGRIILAEIKNLQPLYSQFLELPMIAIRASLNNIIPIGRDWCIDTIIDFKKLVEDREFDAIVQEIINIDCETILLLNLFDQNNQSVADTLVNNERAKFL